MKRVVIPMVNRGNVGVSGSIRHQGRGISAVSPGLDARPEVIQHLLSLPPTGVNDRQDAFDEPTPARAVRPAACLPQQHPVPLGPLSLILLLLHPLHLHYPPP